MKISNNRPINNTVVVENAVKKKKEKVKETAAVIYEKKEPVEKIGYSKPDRKTIDKLKAQSELAYNQLRSLVETLLKKQGKTFNNIQLGDTIEIDDTTRAEAEWLIGPEGPLGAKAVSDRIVEFAKAISGGDISKLDELKKAIKQGFKEAEKILGDLPEISKETYRLVMEKLDKWSEEMSH
ncbi:MAG: hypothetical protein GX968_04795 [Tissierellia bacterium]|nr:hypothetical protein [Tissierellia bacterium]